MFVKYDGISPSETIETPSLDSKTFPSVYDSKFQIRLNCWYTCDSKRNALLDEAMNYRRRYLELNCNFDVDHHNNRIVKCNLYEFQFSNDNKTIVGFLRWIPKLIANTSNSQETIKVLDNFKMIHNFNPIPLTTKRLEKSTKTTIDNESAESEVSHGNGMIDDYDDDETKTSDENVGTWSLSDFLEKDPPSTVEQIDLQPIEPANDPVGDLEVREIPSTNNSEEQKAKFALELENKQLREKISSLKTQIVAQVDDSNTQTSSVLNSVPSMELDEQYEDQILLRGFQVHHKALDNIFQKIRLLTQQIHSAEKDFNQQLNRNVQTVLQTVQQVHLEKMIYWKSYRSSFVKHTNHSYDDNIKNFSKYLHEKLRSFLDICIQDLSHDFKTDIFYLTNNYSKDTAFMDDMEKIKLSAFGDFIREHIFLQQKSTKTIPNKDAVSCLNKHIEKVQNILKTDTKYKGCELKHFYMVNSLLQRLMVFYHCFLVQLPLFNASFGLLSDIETNTIITISTATGSGKSTLLPALLTADGYDKIIVTQPRRLPCSLISKRVNLMVNDDISGWAISGAENNVQGKILYLTDGLLKERLLNDENFITPNTKINKSVVFFIDEVHERSVNIDLCLALFARLFKLNPQLRTKMKLIISSATLDQSVPALFRNISGCSLKEFNLTSLSTLYPVKFHRTPDENLIELVQKLYSGRNRHDQILCFVSSTQDTHENCQLLKEMTKGAINAYPLIQSQPATEQQRYIEQGSVFFSTTVAETSLTFPCLKYVIDTGLINMPVYSLELERTELKEIKTAESTTKQRLGRLGRTQPGEYYALYDYPASEQRKYPVPQICQSDLVNIEFSLRKSRLRTTLREFLQYLPDKPERKFVDDAIKQLQRLSFVSSSPKENLTSLGKAIAGLPDFTSLPMSKAVHKALTRYRCGRDLILLASILSVLNTSTILKSIPTEYKRSEGDFMTLLQVMYTVVSMRDAVTPQQFDLNRFCNSKNLTSIFHVIRSALRRYKSLEKAFSLSNEYRELAQVQSGNWENIAKALLEGFSDRVYASQRLLQGKTQQYVKYNSHQQRASLNEPYSIAVIDRTSTIRTGNKGAQPASLILARDVRYLTAVRSSAVLSFVGQIESSWLEYTFKRELKLNQKEGEKLTSNTLRQAIQQFPHLQMHTNNGVLSLHGPSGHILNAELYIRQQLITRFSMTLASDRTNDNLARNLRSITSMPGDLFGPLRWRWESECQVKVRTKMHRNNGTIEVNVEGLDSQNQAVEKEFKSFLSWLRMCAVIRDPNSGVSPRVLKPNIRENFRDMEAKIYNITDPGRTSVDRWKSLKGPNATRETRMEVVAWIAVCQFHCRLEGGFVRDWVVGNYRSRPANLPPKQWITLPTAPGEIPILHKDLVPSDLDCHLPQTKVFDVESFLDALHGYGINARSFRQDWRYIIVVDDGTKTGPFTMDLIEPHIALTHDRIDFDVSNLSLERGYTKDLGMRVDITGGTCPIQLETIVERIRNKNFQVLRPIDGENGPNTSGTVAERVEKMKSRGWTQIGKPFSFIPNPPSTCNALLVPYPSSTVLYGDLVAEMQKIPGARVLSVEQIKNPDVESLYEYMKRSIAKECPGNDPRERELFHGTGGDAVIQGIIDRGFDDRYFSPSGAWGRGAYFADDPRKSNNYAPPDPRTRHRVIFYNKVLLGVQCKLSQPDNSLSAAPKGHHSVHGTGLQCDEYIVYRYGQALPYLKITYTTP
ncbi:unnamed protein product [Adineta ricciae]|uniref:Poly [ADP-ribose] polymerase n=1 Tax=Adineta ricciae TaxID=249248 RepID=A0A815T2Y3_ADIRI|nr:unnamed protein product [Adineta ricciae]